MSKWISVKDRKPPRFKNVLVYSRYGQIAITCRDNSGKFDNYPLPKERDSVTHWMPLPDPPENK